MPVLMIAPPILILLLTAAVSGAGLLFIQRPLVRKLLAGAVALEFGMAVFLVGFVVTHPA